MTRRAGSLVMPRRRRAPGVVLVQVTIGLTVLGAGPLAGCRPQPPYAQGESRHAVDFHTHIGYGGAERAAEIFAAAGVDVAVNLVGRPAGPVLDAHLKEAARFEATHPGLKLLVFSGVDWSLVDDPEFGALAALNLRQAVAAGARGLKVFKSLGLGVRTADRSLLKVDDPRLDPLWRAAGELGVPVAIHTGDPLAFFEKPTADNERYEELAAHPSWSFFGADFPSLLELLAARDRLVARHPATTFVGVHVGGYPESLDAVAASMRALSNLYVDVAARLPEIGRRDPERARAFFEEFQDRIVLGTDLEVGRHDVVLGAGGPDDHPTIADARRYYDLHWRYFETRDRKMAHLTPIQGRWTIDAIGLSRPTLDKIYRTNARRLLHLDRPR
ncbi:MAG: amidohydrolase family protein [Deltaproteobacteria bacterium]|nr:amidohydrolase family protein [Deltaproteobacteria bacterium]